MKQAAKSTKQKNFSKRTKRSGKSTRKTKGWSTARRLMQAARLRRAQIWRKSTGPKTSAGKKIAAQNARKNPPGIDRLKAYLSDQNRYRLALENWHHARFPKIVSKATFSATLEAMKYHEKAGFLLGKEGLKLLVFGIQILRENNG